MVNKASNLAILTDHFSSNSCNSLRKDGAGKERSTELLTEERRSVPSCSGCTGPAGGETQDVFFWRLAGPAWHWTIAIVC